MVEIKHWRTGAPCLAQTDQANAFKAKIAPQHWRLHGCVTCAQGDFTTARPESTFALADREIPPMNDNCNDNCKVKGYDYMTPFPHWGPGGSART